MKSWCSDAIFKHQNQRKQNHYEKFRNIATELKMLTIHTQMILKSLIESMKLLTAVNMLFAHKAWDLLNMMREYNCDLLDEAVDDWVANGFEFKGDLHKYMTQLAYFLIRNGIHSAYQHIESEVVYNENRNR